MTVSQRKWIIRIVGAALIIAAALAALAFVRRFPMILIALIGLGVVVFLVFKMRASRKTRVIFGFYVAANEILVDSDKSRYHFEITEVIKTGNRIVSSMPDAPPLVRFGLGALYYSIGDHNAAVEQLGYAAEEELLKESRHATPSRQLRRYVSKLRRVERRPKRYANLNAAIASLEQMQQERAGRLLAESQQQLKRLVEAHENEMSEQIRSPRRDLPISTSRQLKSITAPPTISEVLNEVYQEEPKPS